MAKLTKEQEAAEEKKALAAATEALLADLKTSTSIARRLFDTTTPTAEMILGVRACVFVFETNEEQTEAMADLEKSLDLARQVMPTPQPALVFVIFNELYGLEDAEDEKK